LIVAQVVRDGIAKLFVLFLEQGHTLLERLEKELLTNAAPLCVLTVALAT
jgi:hypothetical protein